MCRSIIEWRNDQPPDNVDSLINEERDIDIGEWDTDFSRISSTPQSPSLSWWSIDPITGYECTAFLIYFEYNSVTASTNTDSSSDRFSINDSFIDTNSHTNNNNNNTETTAEDQNYVYIYDFCVYNTSYTNYTTEKSQNSTMYWNTWTPETLIISIYQNQYVSSPPRNKHEMNMTKNFKISSTIPHTTDIRENRHRKHT